MNSTPQMTLIQLFACFLLAINTQVHADTFKTDLALPANGNYVAGSFPVVSTAQSFGGATFDIVYTLSAVSNDTGAAVGVSDSNVGVGSDNDINPNHFTTIEGDGSAGANGSASGGEGLSFTGLSIANFQANGSGLTIADITDLQFSTLTVGAVTHRFDGVDISTTGFGNANHANQGLGDNISTSPFEIPLTTLANFNAPATDLYLTPDNTSSSNRWFVAGVSVTFDIPAQRDPPEIINPEQGSRADWLRGSWGALWQPKNNFNGNIEGVTIDAFLAQIDHLRTIDYVQVQLANSNIFSPVHSAPHDIIESLWQGDTDNNGDPINLVVPRASAADPFLSWIEAIDAAGLKTEVYINSYNLLARTPDGIPSDYPDVSARWENYCDTNPIAQAFINSHPYIDADDPPRRKYMFCYAEFILKEYSLRYGDLIDAWCFDSADNIMEACGDDAQSGQLDDQRIYQAFAEACQLGNPNAAISFNNSVGTATAPFSTPTRFDDYTFGHPFGGAGNMVDDPPSLYGRNFAICEYMQQHNGLPFATTDDRDWNDNVVGHFFPKQSTTAWSAGAAPCLTDEQFVEWTVEGVINGGAITWGTPLVRQNLENSPILTLQPYAVAQLELMDDHFSEFQFPGSPNWRRAETPLPAAMVGMSYSHSLIDGVDFWDPSGESISSVILIGQPAWLTVAESSTGSGVWVLSGDPTEATAAEYSFDVQIISGNESATRMVQLGVASSASPVVANVELNSGDLQRSTVESIKVVFDGNVILADGAVSVMQRSTQIEQTFEIVETTVSQQFTDGQTVATIEFESHVRNSDHALVDGNYQLTLIRNLVTKDGVAMSEDFVFGDVEDDNFFSFYSDMDGNRTSNIFDLLPFRRAYRAFAADSNFSQPLDFDASGRINIFDLLAFRVRYRTSMPFEF